MLKTKQELIELIKATYPIWRMRYGFAMKLETFPRSGETFVGLHLSYRDTTIFEIKKDYTEGLFNLSLANSQKIRPFGITEEDLDVDFFYHWIKDFNEYGTKDQLIQKIKDKTTCASFATTIGLNMYINTHEEQHHTEVQIRKEFLTGSSWRWVTGDWGWYQKTLTYFSEHTPNTPSNFTNNQERFHTRTFASLYRFKDILEQVVTRENATFRQRQQQEENQLRGHATRATDFFDFKIGKKHEYRLFLGVELELEGHSNKEYKTLNILKEHAIFKRDGSLQEGVEICSAPATLDVHKEAFEPFFAGLERNKSDLKATDHCGLHVHIDNSKISTLHMANIHLLVNKIENLEHIITIAGRSPNNYCQRSELGYQSFTNGQKGDSDRYRMVNTSPEKTIEFRLFASTTNFIDFCKRLEFVQAIVDFTRPGEMNLSITQIPLWNNLKEYVLKHRKFYPTLAKVI